MVYAETPVTSDARLGASIIPSPQSVTPAVKTWRKYMYFCSYISLHIVVKFLLANVNHWFLSLCSSCCPPHLAIAAATQSPRGSILVTANSLHALLPLGWLVISLRSWLTPLHLFLRGFSNEEAVVWFWKEPVWFALTRSIAKNSWSIDRIQSCNVRREAMWPCVTSEIFDDVTP